MPYLAKKSTFFGDPQIHISIIWLKLHEKTIWHEYGSLCRWKLCQSEPGGLGPLLWIDLRSSNLETHCSQSEGNKSMTWLETINIRTARVTEAAKVIELCRQHFQSIAVEELLKLSVYCSAKYSTDISIHLEWASNPGSESFSGRAIREALRDFGLISHTVWAKQEEANTKEPRE